MKALRTPNLLLLLALLVANSSTLFAQSNESIEPTQIFKDVDFVAVAQIDNMKELLSEESKEDLEALADWLSGFSGLEADQCTEVLCQFGSEEYNDDPGKSVGFVFRREDDFRAVDIEEFVEHHTMESEEHEEATFYHLGHEPGFYFKGNSMLIGEHARIKQLIETENAELARDVPFLENVSKTPDLCVSVSLEKESFRKLFLELFEEMRFFRRRGGVDVDSSGFQTLSRQVSNANLSLSLSDSTNLELRLTVKNADDIENAKKETEALVQATIGWIEQISEELEHAPKGLQDPMGDFLTICKEMFQGAEYSVEGDEIVVTAKHENAKSPPGLFVTSMRSIMEASSR